MPCARSTVTLGPIPLTAIATDDELVRVMTPGRPFIGSEAVATGRISAHRLRTECQRLYPDIYVERSHGLQPGVWVRGAALWAPAGAVIGGLGAALLHRERWYAPASVPTEIDVYCPGTPRQVRGVRIRRMSRAFPPGHLVVAGGIRFTSASRTAIDVARWEDDDDTAIAKIDAVCNRSKTLVDSLATTVEQMRGLHGVSRVGSLLTWCDELADSPRETRLRLMLVRAGLPAPTPQVTIYNEHGVKIATPDLCYEAEKVAIFYDSELHREKSTWEFDAWANAQLAELGWAVFRVTAKMMRSETALMRQIGKAVKRGSWLD